MPTIKLISWQKIAWRRQLPAWGSRWEDCEFLFDGEDGGYDYLVVFDAPPGDRAAYTCPRENTILIVSEPPLFRLYHGFYVRQFGTVISQPFATRHPRIIQSHAGLNWWYGERCVPEERYTRTGHSRERAIGFDELAAMPPPQKNEIISTVCSNLGENHLAAEKEEFELAFHAHRLAFTRALKRDLPELAFFGAGTRPVDDKAEAIDNYKYHVAVENYQAEHWWSEKLADAYLGYALPIYHGCPNLGDYFPEGSFIPINIYDYPEALRAIRRAIEGGEYERRLPAIIEARRRVLYEHNIFALLSRVVKSLPAPPPGAKRGGEIVNIRRPKPFSGLGGLRDYWEFRRGTYPEQGFIFSVLGGLRDYWQFKMLKRKKKTNIRQRIDGIDATQW